MIQRSVINKTSKIRMLKFSNSFFSKLVQLLIEHYIYIALKRRLRYEYLITVWECQVIKFISRRPLEIKDFSTDTKMNLINVVCLSYLLHIFAGIIDYLRYGVFCFEKSLR